MPKRTHPSLNHYSLAHCKIKIVSPCLMTKIGIEQMLYQAGARKGNLSFTTQIDANTSDGQADIMITGLESGTGSVKQLELLSVLAKSNMKILIHLPQTNVALCRLLVALGIQGLMTDQDPPETLAILSGLLQSTDTAYSPQVQDLLPDLPAEKLTHCEKKVIFLLLQGGCISAVARLLGRNIRTVSAQKKGAMRRLKMNGDRELQVLGGSLQALYHYKGN